MMRTKKIMIFCTLFFFECAMSQLFAQSLSDSMVRKIDQLFAEWDKPGSPGCAVGIVRDDSLIYAKGFGMANLEYGIPNSPEKIFHMASVSKQFTAYSIVLLARQGKLKLEDDIRIYLPWFPDLKQKITIRHLLNHTSGIRDQWQLLAVSGTRIDDVITQAHIVKLLRQQQALNFPPGEQYSYSNSGFTMLAEIVKSVTGQTLRQFTDSAIFRPLRMDHTHFHDDYTEIVKNRAYSYERRDSVHFANSILSYSNMGATSLFTNVNDMAKWIANFYMPKVGDQQDLEQLTQNGRLNNGKELPYALGIMVGKYKGWKEYFHGGADAGYRTFIVIFPNIKMGFIVFSNVDDFPTAAKAYEMADLFIKDTASATGAAIASDLDSSFVVLKDTREASHYAGNYLSRDGMQSNFVLKEEKFYWERNGDSDIMYPSSNDSFILYHHPAVSFAFHTTANRDTVVTIRWPGEERQLVKYTAYNAPADRELLGYTGTYYCPELDCHYGIMLKDHQLWLTSNKYEDTKLKLAGKDDLLDDYWWMSHLKILRDRANRITGFEVNDGRIMHLRFNKL
jgi:CubicO group peptidase (beta-lactamase class C family)